MLHDTLVGKVVSNMEDARILAAMEEGLSGDPCHFSYHI